MIENLIPGAEYTFYVRAIETSAGLVSELSQALDIKIPKDSKAKPTIATPRDAKWKTDGSKIIFTWKSHTISMAMYRMNYYLEMMKLGIKC